MTMKPYNPHEIEPRWQKEWDDADLYKVTEDPSQLGHSEDIRSEWPS